MRRIAVLSVLIGFALAAGAQQMGSQGGSDHGMMGAQGMMGQADAALAEGEVRKVDKEAKKLTIRHGAIPHLEMPPMTMIYQVRDPTMLELKTGDKIKFVAEKVSGALTVTRIEKPQ